MANELDELNPVVDEQGRDINVISKQIVVTTSIGSVIFEILLWVLGIIPGVVFLFMKIKAKNYLQKLQQRIQHAASQVDNYLEQRVVILTNCASLVEKAVDLDQQTLTSITALRAGFKGTNADELRNEKLEVADNVNRQINFVMENYPNLAAHGEIRDAMNQNSTLQREITAAREVYNDEVLKWNTEIFSWPTKQIVAAKNKYTTRIPFSTSKEVKEQAKSNFFNN